MIIQDKRLRLLIILLNISFVVYLGVFQHYGLLGLTIVLLIFSSNFFYSYFEYISCVMLQKGITGRNYHKVSELTSTMLPETLGIVVIANHLLVCGIYFIFEYITDKNAEINYIILSFSMLLGAFLGFVDDIVCISKKVKFFLTLLFGLWIRSSVKSSSTNEFSEINEVAYIQKFFLPLIKFPIMLKLIELACVATMTVVFCNSVNIYAGINGLEVGQAIVIAIILFLNKLYTAFSLNIDDNFTVHQLWSYLTFITLSLFLYSKNKYPALCFIGNIYTYYCTFFLFTQAMLSRSLSLLFLISMPQILNFIVSIPQLIGIIHCPIHRIPLINKKTNCLEPSNNHTLINYWLRIRSHLSELQLFRELMVLQCVTGALGLYIYHKQAS